MGSQKLLPILVVLLVVLVGLILLLQSRPSKRKSGTTAVTPTPTVKAVITDLNEQIIVDINGNGISCNNDVKANCRVDTVVGSYAKGIMPMGYWIAVRKQNKWNVVITGNGIPSCEQVDNYSIPDQIYGNCVERSGQLRF